MLKKEYYTKYLHKFYTATYITIECYTHLCVAVLSVIFVCKNISQNVYICVHMWTQWIATFKNLACVSTDYKIIGLES